jgi:hypothetical protein
MAGKLMDRFTAAGALLALVLLPSLVWVMRDRVLTGRNDFSQLYSGGKLAGGPGLYSREANRQVTAENLGVTLRSVLYSRLPFYALLLKPLSWLPYLTAYAIFQAINFAALLLFIALYRRDVPELPLFAALYLPAYTSFLAGQDTPLLLGLAGVAYALLRSGRDFAGGTVLAVCAIKFHIFLLPWAVTAWFSRRAAAGIAVAGIVLVLLSFVAGGWSWPADYRARASSEELHPGAEHMPTLRAVAAGLGTPPVPTAIVGSVITIAALAGIVWRSRSLELSFAVSLIAGLLTSWHAYSQDAIILLLSFAIILQSISDKPLRHAAVFLTMPFVWWLLLMGPPWSAIVPSLLLGTLILAYLRVATRRKAIVRHAG